MPITVDYTVCSVKGVSGNESIVMSSVCLSVHGHNSKTTHSIWVIMLQVVVSNIGSALHKDSLNLEEFFVI